MNYKILKWTRVVIALSVFLLTLFAFLDFRELYLSSEVRKIIWIQFIPSLLKFITILGLGALGFALVIVLTALFGRVYCSAVCPLGILQDFFIRAGQLFRKKKKFRYSKPHSLLRNILLALTVVVAVFFSIQALSLLDPYSLFGKIATGLFRPAGIWINNLAAGLLMKMDVYTLHLKDQHPAALASLALPVIAFVVVFWLSFRYGRLYCNSICPLGTFLGWISRYPVFKIKLNQTACTQCGLCMFNCKSSCISVKDMSIDHSRCVACFNCLTVCKDAAISFSPARSLKPKETTAGAEGRRKFIAGSVAGLLVFAGLRGKKTFAAVKEGTGPINKKPTTVPVVKNSTVSPPGSLSVSHMHSVCTACQLCVSQCPSGVLQPSLNEYGWSGYLQPFMDYSVNYCTYECARCSEVCPTGAILKLKMAEKKTIQIGKVYFIKENCVVYTENTACGSCSEHCPTQAVRMVPYIGHLTIPETNNEICVGCGACEYACPVVPYKAIYVDGNPIHETAKKPVQEKLEVIEEEDFPF